LSINQTAGGGARKTGDGPPESAIVIGAPHGHR
jgi:hypothetical protein